jgi:hypothetical protein
VFRRWGNVTAPAVTCLRPCELYHPADGATYAVAAVLAAIPLAAMWYRRRAAKKAD